MTSSWLGFKDSPLSEDDEKLSSIDSFIGGVPMIPPAMKLSEKDVSCDSEDCRNRLRCLAQIYCPLDSHALMHRSLLVLVCPNSACNQSLKGWKVFRFQWKVEKEEAEPESEKKCEQMFEQNDEWGSNEGDDWSSPSPNKKPNLGDERKDTPGIVFDQLSQPFLVEFEAENLEKLEEKDIDDDDDDDGDDDGGIDSGGKEEKLSFKDIPQCQAVTSDTFTKFYNRISAEPQQIMRYGGLGEYLAVYNSADLKYPVKCRCCGAAVGCELQLLPSLHNCFPAQLQLPTCSLGVFTCPNTTTCTDFDTPCLRIESLLFELDS